MTLEVYRTVADFRAACEALRARGGRVGLVPTMGALHHGHLTLVDHARAAGAVPAVTIFVNPTQFGPNEDFQAYPRPLERDLALCEERGVWAAFVPPVEEMYPRGDKTRVRVEGLTNVLCGPRRPGHFEGVATVVTKLFAVSGPALAVFGKKDYQQLQVIRRMVRDLLLPIEVLGVDTIREPDGLASSSRNTYLGETERAVAPAIYAELSAAAQRFAKGERRASAIRVPVVEALTRAGFRLDYVELTTAEELEPIADSDELPSQALLAVAAFLGRTRLIDNIVLGASSGPP